MNNTRWVHRKTTDGDVYYDRDTRTVYRSLPEAMPGNVPNLWSPPTFQTEAPLKVYFDFSYLCNLECRHCITFSSPRINQKNELDPDRIMAIMKELASIGVLELGIGGGEPLCRPDLFFLLFQSCALGLNAIVTTNGCLVTEEIAQRFRESGIYEVRVSFDGPKAVHDYIRGPGVYDKALKAIRTLTRAGVRTVPRLTLSRSDPSGLDSLFTDLQSAGASSIKAGLLERRGRASLPQNHDLFDYTRDQTTAALLLETSQKYGLELKMVSDLAGCAELADGGELRLGKIKSCGAGMETAYISPEGKVQPCSGTPEIPFGEVKNSSFMDVWTNNLANAWREQARSSCNWCLCLQKSKIGDREI